MRLISPKTEYFGRNGSLLQALCLTHLSEIGYINYYISFTVSYVNERFLHD